MKKHGKEVSVRSAVMMKVQIKTNIRLHYHLYNGGVIFLAWSNHNAIGFAQCGLRHDYVEGTKSSPVGYLEGIFVIESQRKQGIAKELLCACQNYAKEQGCTEFGSDCELENEESLKFHLRMGFQEANRIICFTKKL